MVTLRHDGFRKVREGLTSLEEVFQICGDLGTMNERRPAPAFAAPTGEIPAAVSDQ